MVMKRTEEFRAGALWIALTSGLTRKRVASDLGVGMSTLNKWVSEHCDSDEVLQEDLHLARENERLRRENRILKEERDVLMGVILGSCSWYLEIIIQHQVQSRIRCILMELVFIEIGGRINDN